VVNKIDLPQVRARLAEIKNAFDSAGTVTLFISAVSGEGVAEVVAEAMRVLGQVDAGAQSGEASPKKLFRPQPRDIGRRR